MRATPDSIAASATAGAHPQQHARVERLRDDVVGAEAQRAARRSASATLVGHGLARQLGERARRGDLHLLVDRRVARTSSAPRKMNGKPSTLLTWFGKSLRPVATIASGRAAIASG